MLLLDSSCHDICSHSHVGGCSTFDGTIRLFLLQQFQALIRNLAITLLLSIEAVLQAAKNRSDLVGFLLGQGCSVLQVCKGLVNAIVLFCLNTCCSCCWSQSRFVSASELEYGRGDFFLLGQLPCRSR